MLHHRHAAICGTKRTIKTDSTFSKHVACSRLLTHNDGHQRLRWSINDVTFSPIDTNSLFEGAAFAAEIQLHCSSVVTSYDEMFRARRCYVLGSLTRNQRINIDRSIMTSLRCPRLPYSTRRNMAVVDTPGWPCDFEQPCGRLPVHVLIRGVHDCHSGIQNMSCLLV